MACRACFKLAIGSSFCDEHSYTDRKRIRVKAWILLGMAALVPTFGVFLFWRIGNYTLEYFAGSVFASAVFQGVFWVLATIASHLKYWLKTTINRAQGKE